MFAPLLTFSLVKDGGINLIVDNRFVAFFPDARQDQIDFLIDSVNRVHIERLASNRDDGAPIVHERVGLPSAVVEPTRD